MSVKYKCRRTRIRLKKSLHIKMFACLFGRSEGIRKNSQYRGKPVQSELFKILSNGYFLTGVRTGAQTLYPN